MKPLCYPAEAELHLRRGWFNVIPLVGLSIESQALAQTQRHIQSQLDARGEIPESEWRTPKTNWGLKVQVDSILQRNIGWTNTWFHPGDPMHILMAAKFGDGCEASVVAEVERLIGHTWPEHWTMAILNNMTYAKFLHELEHEISRV